MEEARQILLLDFGGVPRDRPVRLDYIQLTIGLLIESMATHIEDRRKVQGARAWRSTTTTGLVNTGVIFVFRHGKHLMY